MGRLIITRGRSLLRTGEYAVTVDGIPSGAITRGSRREFELAAGHHVLNVSARNATASADAEFDMPDEGQVAFECNADGMGPGFWLTMIFGAGSMPAGQDSWLHLTRADDP